MKLDKFLEIALTQLVDSGVTGLVEFDLGIEPSSYRENGEWDFNILVADTEAYNRLKFSVDIGDKEKECCDDLIVKVDTK